jgi:predicted negative regulator of RcsB-dependent stress response
LLGFFLKITEFFKTNVNNLIKILIVIFIFFLAYWLWKNKITITIYQEALTNISNNPELIKPRPEDSELPTKISEEVTQAKDQLQDEFLSQYGTLLFVWFCFEGLVHAFTIYLLDLKA